MRREGRATSTQSLNLIDTAAIDRCTCLPISVLHKELWHEQEVTEGKGRVIPVSSDLNNQLRSALSVLFPRSMPISVILLHILQLEHIHITQKSTTLHKRQRYHAPASFLEQVVVNVRRTIRAADQIVMHDGTGAAIIFPQVDQEGVYNIVERVFHSINLLQSETVIPPLKRETDILIGMSSFPKPGSSQEELLYHAGLIARKITLRPAVNTQLRAVKPSSYIDDISPSSHLDDDDHSKRHLISFSGIPFMALPGELPMRLKQLIPYSLALEVRCVPVGRDHNRLTVALEDPTNKTTIRRLREVTGLTIFPVSCDITNLELLLANEW